ncbi:hypothetical protein JHL18_00650 [Clostridium sp. YIM B02505]|uniref:GIY-YIG domain-containing protein n=1 Tax=Clostridium yunnanense TaxID=2800325 RepID=A0ABS1EIG6_9CLOT|nr:hypothetical protein [Clostridium yunnanense]MBK1809157.1 hypothetical protein [Clostridium yunnanense]
MKNLLKSVKGNIYGLGVYALVANGKVLYVGSGMLNDRLQSHLYMLKRGKYEGTNKDILQKMYNIGELSFEVLHFSENNSTYLNGADEERLAVQQALEVLEQFYFDMYKDTCCNRITKITKHSTSPSAETTEKRRKANAGSKNPNCKNDEVLIANIIWLKDNGYENREIEELINGVIKRNYISQIGKGKWSHIRPVRPDWFNETA